MIKCYFLMVLIFSVLTGYPQPPVENVGNPTAPTPVAVYTGWTNQGLVTYTGNAEVQNTNPSNSQNASGGGNVFFTNTPNVYFQISGFPPNPNHDGIEMNFRLFGYDTAHLDELRLTFSKDSGLTWTTLPYKRFFGILLSPTPWDYFTAFIDNNASSIDVSKLMFKFTQTTATKTFRIDDVSLAYYVLLPIKLFSFTAAVNSGKAVLNWNASTNSKEELFVIEKSNDGLQFSSIGQQHAKGDGAYSYTCNDELSRNGKTYYRLKMVNADGTISYSRIVTVNVASLNPKLIQSVYPIPAKEVLHVLLNSNIDKMVNVSVVDVTGSRRMQISMLLNGGIHNYKLNIQHLEKGVYYLIVDDTQTKETQKIVVSR